MHPDHPYQTEDQEEVRDNLGDQDHIAEVEEGHHSHLPVVGTEAAQTAEVAGIAVPRDLERLLLDHRYSYR